MKTLSKALILCTILFIFSSSQKVLAASAIIAPNPTSGTVDKQFTVKIVIDGHGEKFNAAESTVTVSPNFTIKELVLGDCNLSFLQTPTIQNPSFSGIIISSYSTKCTVYTLTLVPNKKGDASIKLSKASVKRYGDAQEILASAKNGTYKLTAALNPSLQPLQNTSEKGLYTLYLKISSDGNTPVKNAKVILNSVSEKNHQEIDTDYNGIAHFSNIKEGIYDAVVMQGFIKTGETIVNVKGSNKILSLGINLDTQKNNPLMKLNAFFNTLITNPIILLVILFLGMVLGVIVSIIILKLLGRRKDLKRKKQESEY